MAADRRVCPALELSDELLISIVTKLRMPLQTIFRLRSVCKTWKTFLSDDHFVRYFFELLSQTPLYIVGSHNYPNELAACDIRIKGWHNWASAIHPKHFLLHDVLGDAGEWLLVKEESDSLEGLFLANPTKRSFRKLPSFPQGRDWVPKALGVGFDESSKPCKVFATDELNFYSHKGYLYDFELDSWKVLGAWEISDGQMMYSMMFYEGALHCIISTEFATHCIRKVCRFDERNTHCQELPAQISGQLLFEKLFEWQGHLMFIGGLGCGQHDKSRLASVHIWQLDKKNDVWVERMRMPDHMVSHLYVVKIGVLNFRLSCAICSDQICLTGATIIRRGKTFRDRMRHVMCDLSKALWWDVPEPPVSYFDNSRLSVLLPKSEFRSC